MIKSIFTDPRRTDGIENSHANHLIITLEGLTPTILQNLTSNLQGCKLNISLEAFDTGGCPANPKALNKLLSRLDAALKFKPNEIWLDHFRFGGHWEAIEGIAIPNMHKLCKYCQNKNRAKVLIVIASKIRSHIPKNVKLGYFAVPFKSEAVPSLIKDLGQDHRILGKIFDLSSPMLYHRMIKKPTSYISDYVSWMHKQTNRPILPIIQIKDMPDNLPDNLGEEEIIRSFNEAIKPPSEGLCFFWWTHILEKKKTKIIQKLFR